MLILLFVLFLFLFLVSLADDSGVGPAISGIITMGLLIALICNVNIIVNGRLADSKIAMYTEENTKIETQINEVVTRYMDYESETLTDLKTDGAITLVSLYPELKSDELIKTQIQTYQVNNDRIKELKEKKINVSNAKWWVYFGK